ncbi:helix-turn-helix domain-containing protein [Natronomonas sp. EA1]|uniref:helix-turn-helix domain-containing protein n=1 Tax=Natronomonas sp. EA1 TaxID=3421655 RepID=UPI003EBA1A0D
MIDLTLDMEQYDCPFIDTTVDHEVSFSAVHWEFDGAARELETRMLVEGADREALENGLDTLTSHQRMTGCTLLAKQEDVAHIRTTIEETQAMGAIRSHDGYVTGPFHIEAGSELWHVGFDREVVADEALSRLEDHNDYRVLARDRTDLADLTDFVQNVGAAMTLIEGCRELSDAERRTLEAAVDGGYFRSPRGATLGTLAEEFGISKPAVSKRLRRGQEKLSERAIQALSDLE